MILAGVNIIIDSLVLYRKKTVIGFPPAPRVLPSSVFSKRTLVPCDLSPILIEKKLIKSYALFLYLKMFSHHKFKVTPDLIKKAGAAIGIKDGRTTQKLFNSLVQLKWISYDKEREFYYRRGQKFVHQSLGIKGGVGAYAYKEHLSCMAEFLTFATSGKRIRIIRKFWTKDILKLIREAKSKREPEQQFRKVFAVIGQNSKFTKGADGLYPFQPKYYGMTCDGIGRLVGLSKSRISQLKKSAVKLGMLIVNKHYRLIKESTDEKLWSEDLPPIKEGRLCVRYEKRRRGERKVFFYEQMMDEIIVRLQFARFNKISAR